MTVWHPPRQGNKPEVEYGTQSDEEHHACGSGRFDYRDRRQRADGIWLSPAKFFWGLTVANTRYHHLSPGFRKILVESPLLQQSRNRGNFYHEPWNGSATVYTGIHPGGRFPGRVKSAKPAQKSPRLAGFRCFCPPSPISRAGAPVSGRYDIDSKKWPRTMPGPTPKHKKLPPLVLNNNHLR